MAKTSILVFIMMWIRWTFPRVRPDHLMNLGWKYLFPLSLLNLILCAAAVVIREKHQWGGPGVALVGLIGFTMVIALLKVIRPSSATSLLKAQV
jgi:lipopolysaccharide export LptBFGC system permease protein LptF